MPRNVLHCCCDCVPSNAVFSHHWASLCLQDERDLLSTRQHVMSHRASLSKRQDKGWSNHSLSCPLPWSPRIHKSSAGIAASRSVLELESETRLAIVLILTLGRHSGFRVTVTGQVQSGD